MCRPSTSTGRYRIFTDSAAGAVTVKVTVSPVAIFHGSLPCWMGEASIVGSAVDCCPVCCPVGVGACVHAANQSSATVKPTDKSIPDPFLCTPRLHTLNQNVR